MSCRIRRHIEINVHVIKYHSRMQRIRLQNSNNVDNAAAAADDDDESLFTI